MLNILHQGCIGLLSYDQSSNLQAFALNDLVSGRMTFKPKKEKTYQYDDGWYIMDYQEIGNPRGLHTIDRFISRHRNGAEGKRDRASSQRELESELPFHGNVSIK
ncbi:hypothetical protein ABG067_004353 [Albugo candida]|uniref:Uncharacterized protein n=1 Tax=Albugo candida TaxID=65357 RepID=A0A024GBF4_9STRA|nr:unnamed protein product [Albugo candida]|eukprot:CCI44098.1 unnamed protein product [Albugo candida]